MNGIAAYDAAEGRRIFGGLIRADSDALTPRPGVLNAMSLLVSASGFDLTVDAGVCVVGTTSDGAYITGLTADNTDLTIEAADVADARKDRVSIQVLDDDIDSGGLYKAQLVYESGTPGSGSYPAVPDNALSLALIDVPALGGGDPAVTDDRDRTTCSGGVLWVPTTAERDTLTASADNDNPILVYVAAATAGSRWQYCDDSANWVVLATQDYADDYHQDTGWRDVSADRGGNFSAGTLHLRRVGRHVELRAYGLTLTSTGGSRVYYVLPAGFRASPSGVDVARPGVLSAASAAHYRTAITSVSASGADVTVYDCPAATALFGALTWITDDDWPSTLPGSAA